MGGSHPAVCHTSGGPLHIALASARRRSSRVLHSPSLAWPLSASDTGNLVAARLIVDTDISAGRVDGRIRTFLRSGDSRDGMLSFHDTLD